MQYRVNPKNGDNLSVLAFGSMRLPSDDKLASELVRHAVDQGVNYFDSAYVYPGKEAQLGKALEGYRDRVKIATKLPPFLVRKTEDFDKIFNTELERLRTDHIDYYLLHMVTDVGVWEHMKELGFLEWYAKKHSAGQILNLGFSYHGGKDEFVKLIDANDWDFCMIQFNFYDEDRQAGRSGLEYASRKGLPVMIMEPLRGGKLVNALPKAVYSAWDKAYVKRSPAEWALRWVWNHPEVTTVLSGMNSMEMLDENIRIASEAQAEAFTDRDFQLFDKVRKLISEAMRVPCTSCAYCMPCPQGVDIPSCFTALNDISIEGKMSAFMKYLQYTSMTAQTSAASRCIKCGKCEKHCPQGIPIRDKLDEVRHTFEGFLYKPARFVVKKVMKF
jgi:predicted aldo/keto reductase-like oxidoreductase